MEVVETTEEVVEMKEYQTLFWVPMLFSTANQAEFLIDEMLDMIQDFHDTNVQKATYSRKGSVIKRNSRSGPPQPPKRRQQIFGEAVDSEPTNITRMDVVMKSDTTKLNLLTVLKRHFLFSQLRDSELDDVVDVMQLYCANEGETIIRQGDQGETFYILEEGTAELFKDNERITDIESGNSFGDLALMYNSPRAATITAKTFCQLWTLDRVFFRQAMITSSSNQYVQLSQFVQKIQLFANMGVSQLNQIARSLTKQSYEDGQYIIRQGEVGDQFYVIFRGRVIVTQTDDSGNEKELISLGEGEVFGERALIKKEPRKANIKASGPVECYYLEKNDFHLMLGEFVEKFNKMNEYRIIRSAKVFAKLNEYRLKELIAQFTNHRMFSGQRIVCGTGTIFIVMDGMFVASNGVDRFAADSEIGSLEHTADEVAGALTVLSDEGNLVSITIEQVLEAMKRSEEDETRKTRRSSYMESRSRSMLEGSGAMAAEAAAAIASAGGGDNSVQEIRLMGDRRRASANARRASQADFIVHNLADLNVLQPLGKGTFGTVFLCQYRHDPERYIALKCLDKRAVVESGQHNYVRREVIALSSFSHPFLGEYFGCILSRSKICFMLEFIPGGELWSYLYDENVVRERGEFGGIPLFDATLYAGNIILALEHMHTLGYTYRDLKPENLMVHSNGYLKLVDFGFAKQVPYMSSKDGSIQYRTFTLCGTPDYMAPELVLSQGHDKSVDYWAYGTLLYELLCGHTPFDSSNQQRTFEKIVHSQKYLSFPTSFDPHCKSLIRRLLHPNGALRIGALQNGIDDIKTHAFFTMKSLDFDALEAQEMEMPYLPQFELGKTNSSLVHIDPLEVEFELTMDDEDEYNEYFAHLNDPDLIE